MVIYHYKKKKKTKKIKSNLNEITRVNPKSKSEKQLDKIKNIRNLYDSRQKIIDLFNDYARIKSQSIYEIKQDGTKRDEIEQRAAGLKKNNPATNASKITNSSCTIKSR